MKQGLIGICVALVLAAVLSGCSRSPRTSYYLLTPAADTQPPASLPAAAPSVAIAAVSLPELVDRPQLVVPGDSGQVLILESHRWAESLKAAVPRVLAENLSRRIGPDRVSFHPQYAASRASLRLFIDVQRFEADHDHVLIDALWSIKRPEADMPVITRRSIVSEPMKGNGYEALAAAYSRALGRLADDLGRAILQ